MNHLCSDELWRYWNTGKTAAIAACSCLLGVCREAWVRPSDKRRCNWDKLVDKKFQPDKRRIGEVKQWNREFMASPTLVKFKDPVGKTQSKLTCSKRRAELETRLLICNCKQGPHTILDHGTQSLWKEVTIILVLTVLESCTRI